MLDVVDQNVLTGPVTRVTVLFLYTIGVESIKTILSLDLGLRNGEIVSYSVCKSEFTVDLDGREVWQVGCIEHKTSESDTGLSTLTPRFALRSDRSRRAFSITKISNAIL